MKVREVLAFLKSAAYVLSLVFIYYFHGYQSNEYYGYGQINFDFEFLLILLGAIIFASFLLGRKYKRPSDFFLLLYGLIVVVPYAVLSDIWGRDSRTIAVDLILIAIPFCCILLICNLHFRLPKFSIVPEGTLTKIILLISILTVVLLLLNRPPAASFSLADSYTRRLETRDVYGSGTIQAYLSSMVMNGALPLLAFVGIFWRRTVFLLAGLFLYLGFFYIYGVKAPLMYMVFAGVFAYSLGGDGDGRRFYGLIGYLLLGCLAVAWLEFLLFDYSYVEDYLVRRLFYVASYLVGAYFELINSDAFSWISGLLVPTSKSISMYVGEDFLGLPGDNANTNTFLYFLAQYGIFGYVFVILLVGFVFSFLNSLRFRNKTFILISIMYSVLLLEQSATTALVSSGIGLLSMVYYFSKKSVNPEASGGQN